VWPITDALNAFVEVECGKVQETFERRIGSAASEGVEDAVRNDSVRVARSDAVRDYVQKVAQVAYATVRSGFWLPAIALAVLQASRGPVWLELILIGLAAFLVLAVVPGLPVSTIFDSMMWMALGVGVLAIIVLLIHPTGGLGVLGAAGLVGLSLACAWAAIRVADPIIGRFWTLGASFAVLAFLMVMLTLALWRYGSLDVSQEWLREGLVVGVIVGVASALVLAAIQSGFAAFRELHELRKLRKVPEAEFVETTLHAMRLIEEPPNHDARDRGRITELVAYVEYLAKVLEQDVSAVLTREDPGSRAVIAAELSKRAEALRAHKRRVLFGDPGAYPDLLNALATAVVTGARRDWVALPAATPISRRREPRRRRLARVAAQGMMLALPVALGVVAWLADEPGLVPFAALWAAVTLLELLKPGAGAEVERSASGAAKLNPPWSRLTSG
jgi:hypothetical protein